MTKKTVKKIEKKATEDKTLSAATLKKINSKLASTKKDLENQVDDLSAQVKKLSKKPGKQALKLLKKVEDGYHKKLVDLQTEFEERLASLSKVQDKVLERLPKVVADKIISTESGIAKTLKAVTLNVKKPIVKKPAAKPRAKVAIKASTIASIKGIGPVMQKKLAEKGISTLADIANTPKSKVETLKQFEKERGFGTWKDQAKALLADK
ncbi:MAG: putative flap endonuclease-1-like 5' DNA nuclease [Paraglaciecola sp.]|jgi:predicted flap endonuclease-1-like 5' DNA nuclease